MRVEQLTPIVVSKPRIAKGSAASNLGDAFCDFVLRHAIEHRPGLRRWVCTSVAVRLQQNSPAILCPQCATVSASIKPGADHSQCSVRKPESACAKGYPGRVPQRTWFSLGSPGRGQKSSMLDAPIALSTFASSSLRSALCASRNAAAIPFSAAAFRALTQGCFGRERDRFDDLAFGDSVDSLRSACAHCCPLSLVYRLTP